MRDATTTVRIPVMFVLSKLIPDWLPRMISIAWLDVASTCTACSLPTTHTGRFVYQSVLCAVGRKPECFQPRSLSDYPTNQPTNHCRHCSLLPVSDTCTDLAHALISSDRLVRRPCRACREHPLQHLPELCRLDEHCRHSLRHSSLHFSSSPAVFSSSL
jgi:hypothetical protein